MTQTGGIYHHPDYFDEPEAFKPERYLNNSYGTKTGVNTAGFRDNLHFGAGRVYLFAPVPVHSYNGLLAYLSR
jgi:cytochrome P450